MQCLQGVCTDTRKVDVQLILGTAHSRVDCQTDAISWKRLVQRLVDISSNFPCVSEIVRCVWPTNDWTLDAGDSSSRNEQELSAPSWVPYDRESTFGSTVHIHLKAGTWVMVFGLTRDA